MKYMPILEKTVPTELAGLRVEASSFREAKCLISAVFDLYGSMVSQQVALEASAAWKETGQPILRDDGKVVQMSAWCYLFDTEKKAWLRAGVETMEQMINSLGYSTVDCNHVNGIPLYDGDALVVRVEGVNPSRRQQPAVVLGLRSAQPGAPWLYTSGGTSVPTMEHPTLLQAVERIRGLAGYVNPRGGQRPVLQLIKRNASLR